MSIFFTKRFNLIKSSFEPWSKKKEGKERKGRREGEGGGERGKERERRKKKMQTRIDLQTSRKV